MSKAWSLIEKLRRDEDGAALIEYTVLLGILVVAVIATCLPARAAVRLDPNAVLRAE